MKTLAHEVSVLH